MAAKRSSEKKEKEDARPTEKAASGGAPDVNAPEKQTVRKPRWVQTAGNWVKYGGAFLLSLVILRSCVLPRITEPSYEPGEPVQRLKGAIDTDGWPVVFDSTIAVAVNHPYYTEVPFDSLRQNDVIHYQLTGAGGIDPDINDLQIFGGDDIYTEGWDLTPKKMPPTVWDWHDYILPNERVGIPMGVFGKVIEHPKKGVPFVPGFEHFKIGTEAWIVVPAILPGDKNHVALNDKWTPDGWEKNWGEHKYHVTVYRPPPGAV